MIKIKILKKPSPNDKANDKVKNPITGRMIKRNGATHKKLIKIKILEKPKIKTPKPKMVKIKILEKKKPKPKMVKIKILEKKKDKPKPSPKVLENKKEEEIIPKQNIANIIATKQDEDYAVKNNYKDLKNKGAFKVGQIVREKWNVNENNFFNYYKIKKINKITLIGQEINIEASPYKIRNRNTENEVRYYYIDNKNPKLKSELTRLTRFNIDGSTSENFVVITTIRGAHIDHLRYLSG